MGNKIISWKNERLGLAMIVASLLVISIIIALLFMYQQASREKFIQVQGSSLTRLLAGMPEQLVNAHGHQTGVLELLRQGQDSTDFAYAVVSDPKGDERAVVKKGMMSVPLMKVPVSPSAWTGQLSRSLASGQDIVEFHAPLLSNGQLIGYIRLGYFKPSFGSGTWQIPSLAMIALPIFLLTPFFYFLLRREIRPLKAVNKDMEYFMSQGDFPEEKVTAPGELGGFVDVLNRFMDVAQKRIHHLETEQVGLLTSTKVLSFRRARVEAVLQSLPDAILVLDESGMVSYLNSKAEILFDVRSSNVLGKDPKTWCEVPEVARFLNRFDWKGQGNYVTEVVEYSPQATPDRTIGVIALPLFSSPESANPTGTLVQFRDVTEEVLAKRSRGEFVAQVAHEIKTPLNVLAMYSESLLGEDGDSEEFRVEALNVIHDEVERLSTLINNLLSLTKFELGGMSIERQRVRLHDLLRDAFSNISQGGLGKNLEFIQNIPTELSSVFIDKGLFRIAINNLLTNAIKYNRPGGKVILSALETDDEIRISVRDTGIGIASVDQKNIYEKFFRSNDEQVRDQTGHGLGLPLVQQIIHLHHGEIELESKPGEGSEFTISIGKETGMLKQAVGA